VFELFLNDLGTTTDDKLFLRQPLATPLTFSIATGLSLGLISYTVVKVAAGKIREINVLVWILTVLFILRYVYLAAS